MKKYDGILIVGPTGSGKTPLGDALEIKKSGYRHFDFGANLRKVAAGELDFNLSVEEVTFVKEVLKSGALFENETFFIVEKILWGFLKNTEDPFDWVIMNGLPRHVDQAKNIEKFVTIKKIIALDCTPEIITRRIASDAGGDRGNRVDDGMALVRKKIELFNDRTLPLIDFFKEKGADYYKVNVQIDSTPMAIIDGLKL